MINSVSRTSSSLGQAAATYSSANKGNGFSQALTSAAKAVTREGGVTVTISEPAKAKEAAAAFDFDFYYSASHSHEEYKAYLAEGAHNVSQQQGLPDGKYDFSRMSPKQAMVVMNDAIVNRGVSLDDIGVLPGFSSDNMTWEGGKPVYSDTPMDAFSQVLSQQVSTNGGPFGVSKETIAWMTSVQAGSLSADLNAAIFKAVGIAPNSSIAQPW